MKIKLPDLFKCSCTCSFKEHALEYRVLLGAMALCLCQSMPWFHGTLVVYEYSYFKYYRESETDVDQAVRWIYPVYSVSLVIGMLSVDLIKRRASPTLTLLLGLLIEDAGLFLSFLAVKISVGALMFTIGFLYGFSHGVTMSLGFLLCSTWFEGQMGKATALVTSTNGVGGLIFNAVIVFYMNSDNVPVQGPDNNNMQYFEEEDVNSRLPTLFLFLGIICAFFQFLGLILLDGATGSYTYDTKDVDRDLCSSVYETKDIDRELYKSNYISKSNSDLAKPTSRLWEEDFNDFSYSSYGSSCKTDTETLYTSYLKAIRDECSITIETEKGGNFNVVKSKDINSKINSNDENSNCSSQSYCDAKEKYERKNSVASDSTAQEQSRLPPILRSIRFYVLWFGMLSLKIGFIAVIDSYALFGHFYSIDNSNLGLRACLYCIVALLLGLTTGVAVDSFGVYNTVIGILSSCTICTAFWYLASIDQPAFFVFWSAVTVGLQNSAVSVFPVAIFKCFGPTQYITNTSILMTSSIVASVFLPPEIFHSLATFDWMWFFTGVSILSCLSLVCLTIRILTRGYR